MTLVSGVIAQLLHIALMAVASPTFVGIIRWIEARLAGRVGPPLLQPWRDARRLLRKQTVLAESASELTSIALPVAGAAVVVAVCLVPSFVLRMTFAPLADLLVIAGLLMLVRVALAVAALDAGTAMGGMAASRTMLLACLAEPVLLLVVFVLSLVAGSSNLDLIAAMQIEIGVDWRAGVGLALAAMMLLALVETMRREPLATEFGGRDLALIEAIEALRFVVWFNLIGAAFLPYGMASADGGPIAWIAGFGGWLVRSLLFVLTLALLRTVLGRMRWLRACQILGVAVLFSLLAAIFLFAGMRTA